MVISSQNYGIKIWKVDYIAKKLSFKDVDLGTLKRKFNCVYLDPLDKYAYLGTKTGDVIEVDIKNLIYKRIGPMQKLFPQGVSTIKLLPNSDLIVGTEKGIIAKLDFVDFKIKAQSKIYGGITSITFTSESAFFFCGTKESNIYWISSSNLKAEIRNTCHRGKINEIHFPFEYSGVFGTCSNEDIRIWNSDTHQEHLRITVPNIECYCFNFSRDGKTIFSGWHDGKIRGFKPQSGKLIYCVNEAHLKGVTAIAGTPDSKRIISGGMGGEVRVWKISEQESAMITNLKEHRGRVWSIVVNSSNDRAISASADGSCIIWDIKNYSRVACMFEKCVFKQLAFHPGESQVLSTGNNRKISYWDAVEGTLIRTMEGSLQGEITSLDVAKNGEYFVSAGEDKELKIWEYLTGIPKWRGLGHGETISKVAIAPNQEFIVSVGMDGSIFIFETPKEVKKGILK